GRLPVGDGDRLVALLALHLQLAAVELHGEVAGLARQALGHLHLAGHRVAAQRVARHHRTSAAPWDSTTLPSCCCTCTIQRPSSIRQPLVVSVSPGNTTPLKRAAKLASRAASPPQAW